MAPLTRPTRRSYSKTRGDELNGKIGVDPASLIPERVGDFIAAANTEPINCQGYDKLPDEVYDTLDTLSYSFPQFHSLKNEAAASCLARLYKRSSRP